jgi:hypothetical protein
MLNEILPNGRVGWRRHKASAGTSHSCIAMVLEIGVPDDPIVEFDFEAQSFYEMQQYSLSLLLNCRLDTDELEFEHWKRTAIGHHILPGRSGIPSARKSQLSEAIALLRSTS